MNFCTDLRPNFPWLKAFGFYSSVDQWQRALKFQKSNPSIQHGRHCAHPYALPMGAYYLFFGGRTKKSLGYCMGRDCNFHIFFFQFLLNGVLNKIQLQFSEFVESNNRVRHRIPICGYTIHIARFIAGQCTVGWGTRKVRMSLSNKW